MISKHFSFSIIGILLLPVFLFLGTTANCQKTVTRDIKSFGAKGDGKTNDHAAFQKAAEFFNKRGGNGKLVISKGVYLVGQQIETKGVSGRFNWEGQDVMYFTKVNNFTIEGLSGSTVKYAPNLRFGSFNPQTGKARTEGGYFVNPQYAASLGHCIFIDQSKNITIKGIELNGNNENIRVGGYYGDVGIQLPHYGIFIQNSKSVTVSNVFLHHFALDGICVANIASTTKDKIQILNSRFDYNSRQGLSWIGGNDLYVYKSKFSHTGKTKISSPPGAGVDIEAEYGPIRNGVFVECEFVDSQGVCMVADSGDSGDCTFTNCTFWSSTTWSVWTTKPGFTFKSCKIYGPVVHGYDSPNDKDATKYINCHFEDKPYNGKQPGGEFLIETNNMRRVRFENCTMIANDKKLFWISAPAAWSQNEKYQLIKNTFIMKSGKWPATAYAAVLRGAYYKGNTFHIYHKEKGYYINECCEAFNIDAGANKTIMYSGAK